MTSYIPLLSTLAAFIAGTLMLKQYINNKEVPYAVAVGSMYLFSLGAFLEFLSSYFGYWPETLYRLYYGTSPVQPGLLAAAVLGLYSYMEFENHKKIFKGFTAYVAVLGVLVLALSFVAEVKVDLLSNPYIGGAAMATYVRMLSPPLTIPSGLIIIGYPIYAYIKGLKSIDKILFPVAALVVMIGGVLIRRGLVTLFYYFELAGAIILLIAFYIVYKAISK